MPENHPHTSLPSEDFGSVPKDAEGFGTIPHDAERFRNIPKGAERGENHTLTVREAARMFEAAGVARTERSIVNWCQPNKNGIARLDSYFDPNERKYYITPQSVELAIAEEKAKSVKLNQPAETFGTMPKVSEMSKATAGNDESRIKELERENLDLKIANRGRDFLIEKLQEERKDFFEQLLTANRKVGELEAKLLRLESPDAGVN